MSLKIKLVSLLSAFILILSMLLFGVLAITNFSINLKGNVQFDITNNTLYIKDIRLNKDLTNSKTIDNFMPGFASENFTLNLGEISSEAGAIQIEVDVINTTTTSFSASSSTTLNNAELSVSGTISGDGVAIENVTNYDGVSGTITILITTSTTTSNINLDNINISLSEESGFNVTVINNHTGNFFVHVNGQAIEIPSSQQYSFTFTETNLLISMDEIAQSDEESNIVDVTKEYSGRPSKGGASFYVNDLNVLQTDSWGATFQLVGDCVIVIEAT